MPTCTAWWTAARHWSSPRRKPPKAGRSDDSSPPRLVGVPPERMAYAAVPAARKALEKARWRAKDVELWEINETFAAQVLLDCAELAVPEEKANVRGGAIALGHPFAATGLRLVLSLLLELKRRGGRRGAAAISVGGGLGIAACVEAL
ncbi:MAG: hypothetical protein AAB262_04545 [Elusimicrobiota bacterium]